MDPVLTTPRLKLTLLTSAERGSQELAWLHELRSNKQATAWSIHPPSASLADTEQMAQRWFLPPSVPGAPTHHVYYAVHAPDDSSSSSAAAATTHFIGLVTLVSTNAQSFALPPALVVPDVEAAQSTLVVELGYSFLPAAWGKGYAGEALRAVLGACRSGRAADAFWGPGAAAERVWMRVIVNARNPASLRVMRKLGAEGVREMGIYEWKGEAIFIGGQERTEDDLHIFGGYLRGGDC